jgi:hypothetical protein
MSCVGWLSAALGGTQHVYALGSISHPLAPSDDAYS